MAFSDYRRYTASELRNMFQVEIKHDTNLFHGFVPSGEVYPELQANVVKMSSRLRFSKFDNEATRGRLMVSQILWKAGDIYNLGVFFEPTVTLQQEILLDLPHTLDGAYDGALSLDEIDLVSPIISIVKVKRSSISDGFGQCLGEMYTTLQVFQQEKVYGIVTNGEIWEFLLLENSIVSVDVHNYYVHSAADIVDRIGYISTSFT